MVAAAIVPLRERTGSSRIAILKYIKANFKVGDHAATCVKNALKKGVTSGALTQVKGVGSNGSFKVKKVEKPKKVKKPKTPKKKPSCQENTEEGSKETSSQKKKTAAKKPSCKENIEEDSKETSSHLPFSHTPFVLL